MHSLWIEYLLYLRSKALGDEDDFTDFDNFRAFSSAVHRCLIAVDFVKQLPCADPDSGGESSSSSRGVHEDYSFHDQVRSAVWGVGKGEGVCVCVCKNCEERSLQGGRGVYSI